VATAALALFGLLTASVVTRGPSSWDRQLFRHLYSGESDWGGGRTPGQSDPALNAAEPFLHRLLDARVLLVLAAVVIATLVVLKRRRAAAFFTAGLAVTGLVPVLKPLVDRPSPFPLPGDPSFPSGHATLSMAIAAGVVAVLARGRWRWLAGAAGAVLVLAVGVAVIADSGHWPSDVLAGWCLALAWVAALSALAGRWLGRSPVQEGRTRAATARDVPTASARSPGGV
jgi:undecaprenyl-diphosphatase